MKSTKHIWDAWEILAIEYLQKKGYSICDTNFKFGRFGEIDIIASKEEKTIFFEVKYRNNTRFWEPEESVTSYKLSKCRKTIDYYCKKHNIDFQNIQFDVITILRQEKSHRLTHYKNIEFGF
jgi:putative endonuclease